MKSEKFSTALGEIDVSYIEEVVNYKSANKRKKQIRKLAAACVAVVVLAVGVIPLLNRGHVGNQGFVLVAYASENNVVVEHELQEGKSVPISFFETENGLKGFVFAHNKINPDDVSSISVMTEGEFPGVIEEIIGLELDNNKNYTLYIPEQGKDFPYSFMIPYTDEASNKVIFCYLLVEETEDGYSAVVERMEEFERKLKE